MVDAAGMPRSVTRLGDHRSPLQLSVFAVKSRNLARSFSINYSLLEIGALVPGDFTLPDTKLGLEFAVLPIELQRHERATGNVRLAVQFVDFMPV